MRRSATHVRTPSPCSSILNTPCSCAFQKKRGRKDRKSQTARKPSVSLRDILFVNKHHRSLIHAIRCTHPVKMNLAQRENRTQETVAACPRRMYEGTGGEDGVDEARRFASELAGMAAVTGLW